MSNLSNGPVINPIQWLQAERLLANPLRCVPCNRPMDLTERNQRHVDGYIWLVHSTNFLTVHSAGRFIFIVYEADNLFPSIMIRARSIQVTIMQFVFQGTFIN